MFTIVSSNQLENYQNKFGLKTALETGKWLAIKKK